MKALVTHRYCEEIKRFSECLDKAPGRQPMTADRNEWAEKIGISVLELNRIIKDGKRAESKLFTENRGIIIKLAKRYQYNGATIDDLIQEGFYGLRKAAIRFNPQKGHLFSTYAFWWIRDSIQTALKSNFNEYESQGMLCLDGIPVWESEKIQSHSIPMQESNQGVEILHLQDLINYLTPYEAELLSARYGLKTGQEKTLGELGKTYQCSYETIRRHINAALKKLREIYALQELQCA